MIRAFFLVGSNATIQCYHSIGTNVNRNNNTMAKCSLSIGTIVNRNGSIFDTNVNRNW